MIEIRKVTEKDFVGIWEIIKEVIASGDTYVFNPDSSRASMLDYWCAPDKHTYVAILDGSIVGTFFVKANQPGLGSHVANAGYMVSSAAGGKGVGKAMCEFSLDEARRLGFKSMQFNFVVSSNEKAVSLWKKMGFEIIGVIPEGFNHIKNGPTDAYIMFRKL